MINRRTITDLADDSAEVASPIVQTGSAAENAARQRNERKMQKQLDAFTELQQAQDSDDVWTEEDQQQAEAQFRQEQEEEEKGRHPVSVSVLEKALEDQKASIIAELEGDLRLLPYRRDAVAGNGVTLSDTLKPIWGVVSSLLAKIPEGAVSELYLCLKKADCPSLNVDDATVIATDDNGDPLWYIQFDYLRGVATPEEVA